jgi:hypothetical protein
MTRRTRIFEELEGQLRKGIFSSEQEALNVLRERDRLRKQLTGEVAEPSQTSLFELAVIDPPNPPESADGEEPG